MGFMIKSLGADLWIMAKRSSVVRDFVGDRNTLSSSGLDSSLRGDTEGSLGVLSVAKTHRINF